MKHLLLILFCCYSFSPLACEHEDCNNNTKHNHKNHHEQRKYGPEVKTSDNIIFSSSWIRAPSSKAKNTAAYFKVTNNNPYNITIREISVSSDIAERAEIHGYKTDNNDIKKMFKLESVTVPANTTIEFAPSGYHIMLMRLKQQIVKDSDLEIDVQYFNDKPNNSSNSAEAQKTTIKFKAN
ncbi:MAG: copper chaperone PCu(A)C [Rickettsiaceae bacterium]|nr:copper chaperone PCu(A)C [Rickettsiaceae bacterium]